MRGKADEKKNHMRTTEAEQSLRLTGKGNHRRYRDSKLSPVGGIMVLALVFIGVTTGCQGGITVGTTPAGETKSLTHTLTQGAYTDSGSGAATSAATSSPDTKRVKRTGEIALEKYLEARSKVTSEKMVQLWSVESSYPFKSGENTTEWNFDSTGDPDTGRGSLRETYGSKETLTEWFLSPETFTVVSGEETQSYPREEVQEINRYDLEDFLTKVLLGYPVREENGNYFARVTTQSETEIRAFMEDLGYRKEEDLAGNLYMEIYLNAATGHLHTINYDFTSSREGYTDNGQITLSNWNVPVSYLP